MDKFVPPFQDKYSKTDYGSPRDSRDETTKLNDPVWFVRKGEWLYSLWLRGYAYVPFSQTTEFFTLRRYAQGNQPNVKYMDILDPKDPHSGQRKGFYNISWDILPIFPKYRDRIRGALSRLDFNTSAQLLDDNSNMERTYIKLMSLIKQREKEWEESINAAMGLTVDPEVEQEGMLPKPNSIQEMEMIEQMGGYRLPLEASMEKLLYKSQKLSEWELIKQRLEEDLIDLGIAVVQDYTDPISKKPMARYVDPAFWIAAATRDNAYSEISDAAEIRFMTLAELKDYGLKDDQIKEAALLYQNYYSNPSWNGMYRNGQWDWTQLSMFRVAVLDMDFSSWNTDFYEIRTLSNGQEAPYRVSEENYGSNKKRKYQKKNYERRYQGKWVIGSKIMLPGYGYQYNMVFDSDNRPKSSYSAYRVGDRSITSRCVSTLDDIQLTTLKFRNAWAKAKPKGLSIEWGSLTGMSMGGRKMDPMDIMQIYNQSGDLIYRAASVDGRPMQGMGRPVEELGGSIGDLVNDYATTMNIYIGTLGDLTGVGRGQDGNAPAGDTLVGVMNIAESAMQDTFRPMVLAYKAIKTRVFNNLALRWQLTLADKDIDEYVNSKEGFAGDIVRLSYDDVRGRRMQITCDMLIDDTQRQLLLNAATESLKAAKAGQVGITFADFLVIIQSIERGQIKFAWMWMHYREEQSKLYQMQLQQQNMQMNQQSGIAIEQAKQQGVAMELQANKEKIQMEGMVELMKIQEKGKQDRDTLNLQFALQTGVVAPTVPSDQPSPSLGQPSPTLSDSPVPEQASMPSQEPSMMPPSPSSEMGMAPQPQPQEQPMIG